MNFYKVFISSILFCTLLMLCQCTTAMYGQTLIKDPVKENVYTFKVYVGGFAGQAVADERATKEIATYMKTHGFTSYKILQSKYNFVPSYFDYVVELNK
jgi:hypothetical protein